MGKFKCSLLVIIQSSDQPRIFYVGDLNSIQNIFYLFVVATALLAQELCNGGQCFYHGLVFWNLAVKDAQRIGYGPALAVGAHFCYDASERLAQGVVEFRSIGQVAY